MIIFFDNLLSKPEMGGCKIRVCLLGARWASKILHIYLRKRMLKWQVEQVYYRREWWWGIILKLFEKRWIPKLSLSYESLKHHILGKIHSPDVLHSSLSEILRVSQTPAPDDECVGSLTTLERDKWAELREALEQDDTNRQTLRSIDDGLFLLCLDDVKTQDPARLVQSLLCGDDGRNRWFDKCFQLIIDKNGQSTINFEHSWGDGKF